MVNKIYRKGTYNSNCNVSDISETLQCGMCNRAVVECTEDTEATMGSPTLDKADVVSLHKNVGMAEGASVLGCNANNSNASVRTLNSNNAVSNSNDNYAGAFALEYEHNVVNNMIGNIDRKPHSTCSTRTKITEEVKLHNENGIDPNNLEGLLRDEYSTSTDVASESPVNALFNTDNDIWADLKKANHKRHLKGLKKFLTNETIVRAGVERCLSKASKSRHRDWARKHEDEIVEKILLQMKNETYKVGGYSKRVIHKKGKDGKDRNAKVLNIYDRCVENVIFIIIKEKLTNKISRHIYSGIEKRSLFSKTKAYCLKDRLFTYINRHKDDYIVMTDIRHFYDTLSSKVVLNTLSKTIYDRYMMKLLTNILMLTKTLPIGSTLSQLFAMLVLSECDEAIIKEFHPTFYCGFGDNRLFGDSDKEKVIKMRLYQAQYYKEHFNLEMKDDYSLHKVSDTFSFCKTRYCGNYVKIRGELKRRAIRAKIKGQQHYAGYKGFLMKTDSKKLRNDIENGMYFLKRRIKIMNF